MTEHVCDQCGKQMAIRTGRFGEFLSCSGYPECKTTKSMSTGVSCPEAGCDGKLLEKRSRKGKTFYGCSRYPKCKHALWNKPVNRACPQCGASVRGHTACPACGYYKGRQVLTVDAG